MRSSFTANEKSYSTYKFLTNSEGEICITNERKDTIKTRRWKKNRKVENYDISIDRIDSIKSCVLVSTDVH